MGEGKERQHEDNYVQRDMYRILLEIIPEGNHLH